MIGKYSAYRYMFVLIMSVSLHAYSQDIYQRYGIYRNPVRVAVNKITWTFTTGYAGANFKHQLGDVYYYNDENGFQLIPKNEFGQIGNRISVGTVNWLNNPQLGFEFDSLEIRFDPPFAFLPNPVNNPALRNDYTLIDTDTILIGWQRNMHTIPINFGMMYDFDRFRIGVSYGFERVSFRLMNSQNTLEGVENYTPDLAAAWFRRWQLFGGVRFIRFWNHEVYLQGQFGRLNYGNRFGSPSLSNKFHGGFGLSYEYVMSEYLRIVIRPTFDFRKYQVELPESLPLTHRHNTLFVAAGININIPEIPRTPIKADHVQLKHVIEDPKTGRIMEVRGQPFWKHQNPKVGQNHRKLVRYKWRNKRKMNPY